MSWSFFNTFFTCTHISFPFRSLIGTRYLLCITRVVTLFRYVHTIQYNLLSLLTLMERLSYLLGFFSANSQTQSHYIILNTFRSNYIVSLCVSSSLIYVIFNVFWMTSLKKRIFVKNLIYTDIDMQSIFRLNFQRLISVFFNISVLYITLMFKRQRIAGLVTSYTLFT